MRHQLFSVYRLQVFAPAGVAGVSRPPPVDKNHRGGAQEEKVPDKPVQIKIKTKPLSKFVICGGQPRSGLVCSSAGSLQSVRRGSLVSRAFFWRSLAGARRNDDIGLSVFTPISIVAGERCQRDERAVKITAAR